VSPIVDKIVRHSRGLPGPRERRLSFAVSDSAVLRMLLFIAALDIAGLRGKSDSPDIMYWKGETLQTINARLGDSKKMATDGTIAAVASLAHLEVSFDYFHSHRLAGPNSRPRIYQERAKRLEYMQLVWKLLLNPGVDCKTWGRTT
jgi:hypothetical protein